MKKSIQIIINHILPLLLLIAIGIAAVVGIGKASGLLAGFGLGRDGSVGRAAVLTFGVEEHHDALAPLDARLLS
ncbi:MAG TPA: hypothetical protein VN282_24925 [Pyrinomonadaceae bacterium]|nr:hypothetical protein [Pyrinomonadaceae bacterium]